MKLLRLSLRNFKGVRELTVEPDGKPFAVYGSNATGKTTLADAWFWILFGKDSAGRADFEIKTLTETGEAHHGLDHEVEAELELPGGRRKRLRRVYHETWTKRRGEARRQLTGHTTDYFVDGVPLKKAEYEAEVAEIAPEATFRLLTDPLHFPERLHWQDRRRLLLEVCGDVADADVVAADGRLAALEKILADRPLEDHRKVIAARRAEINRELDRIPVRIDEANRAMPAAPERPEPAELAALEAARRAREEARAELLRLESGGEVAEKTVALRGVEAEIARARTAARAAAEAGVDGLRKAVGAAQDRVADAELAMRKAERASTEAGEEIARLERQMDERRAEWQAANGEQFTPEPGAETCAACGQPLPAAKVEAARARALEQFNTAKASRLEALDAEGRQLKTRRDELAAGADARVALIAEANEADCAAKKALYEAEEQLRTAREAAPDPESDPAVAALTEKRTALEAEIADLRASTEPAAAAVRERLESLGRDVSAGEAAVAAYDQRRRGLARIEELKAEEGRLAEEFERLEQELFLTEEFTRVKVRLLEERINSRFRLARFRMFRELVNGGLEECCEVTVNGVPYSAGLNHGARVQVGMDIISTLQAHFDFRPPLWVDQAESFVTLPEMDCQVIKLAVSGDDAKLRIEVEDGN